MRTSMIPLYTFRGGPNPNHCLGNSGAIELPRIVGIVVRGKFGMRQLEHLKGGQTDKV